MPYPETDETRIRREATEIRGLMTMVASGAARRMSVSGYLVASVAADLRQEALGRGLELTVEPLGDEVCVVRVSRRP